MLGVAFSTFPQTCSRSQIIARVGNILTKKSQKQKFSHDPDKLKTKLENSNDV